MTDRETILAESETLRAVVFALPHTVGRTTSGPKPVDRVAVLVIDMPRT